MQQFLRKIIQQIKIYIYILLLISCSTTNTRKNLPSLPNDYKVIYPDSNNFTFYDNNSKYQIYVSKNGYKNTITGLFFDFGVNDSKNEKNYAINLKYCSKNRASFKTIIVFAGTKTITFKIGENRFYKKYDNGLGCEISIFGDILLEEIYNFYKTNEDIKIKFIGKDGKSYIVPVPQQQRKDLIELVDYYRMLTHKSE